MSEDPFLVGFVTIGAVAAILWMIDTPEGRYYGAVVGGVVLGLVLLTDVLTLLGLL